MRGCVPRPEQSATAAAWTARWAGGMATDVETARGHRLRVDEPASVGGDDSGPMPTELLAAALASCYCISVVWAMGKLRMPVEDVRVRVTPRRAPGEPWYEAYDLDVVVTPRSERVERAIELASRYCWVSNTLRRTPEIRYRLAES